MIQLEYTVKPGDTLYSIAQRFNTTISAILNINPQITNPALIMPGQKILIPDGASMKYTIQPNDTLYTIAQRFNITLNQLLAANPQITNPALIYPGQVINIPSANEIVNPLQPYTYEVMSRDINQLKQRYTFLQSTSIGNSVLGKSIPAIRLGRGNKQVHYNASIHSLEWITTPLLMKFIETYCQYYVSGRLLMGYDIRQLYDTVSIWIVPMINPDGVNLVLNGLTPDNPFYNQLIRWNNGSTDFSRTWNANIRGVDLNHNFPAGWEIYKANEPNIGIFGPGPTRYAGPAPLSEPESKALYDFTLANNFQLILAYHSQGQVIYWNYKNLAPPISRVIVNEFSKVSGYTPIGTLTGPAAESGYKDWFILHYRRPGFTVEVGRGVKPVPVSQFPTIWRNNIGILLLAAVVV
ncbi:MAG: M14 family metallopeptidase [Clostridia bacterium]|nr:M14 family metallopeptidase [Clostridia bacterium]